MRIETIIGAANVPKMQANHSTNEELKELIAENLIGEQSRSDNFYSSNTINEFRYNLWSERSNSQYWALKNDGPLGEQASDYLQQMVDGRRAAATDYLGKFFTQSNQLATRLDDHNGITADLDQLMDNVAAGRAPSENADGSTLPKSEIIEAFWADNEQALSELQASYETLKDYPKHLSDWLDKNNIERPLEMDTLIEKHRYSGLNGQYENAEALLQTRSNMLNLEGHHEFRQGTQIDYSFDALKGDRLIQRMEWAEMSEDAAFIANVLAVEMMHNDRKDALSAYTQQYQPLADTFNNEIAADLTPRFTMQDLLDNLAAGKNPALMDNGTLHPGADKIQAFANNHQATLEALNQKQADLEALPVTAYEWMQNEENADRAYREVQSQYGLERWEQGKLARRGSGRLGESGFLFNRESFENADTFSIGDKQYSRQEWKEMLQEKAHELENSLLKKLHSAQSDTSGDRLDLDQLIDNFRNGRPLGSLPDGSLHPAADKIEQYFGGLSEQLAAYIDSEWLRDGSFKPPEETEQTSDEIATELLALIAESRKAWSFDTLMTANTLQATTLNDTAANSSST